jgi:hypothetical protein
MTNYSTQVKRPKQHNILWRKVVWLAFFLTFFSFADILKAQNTSGWQDDNGRMPAFFTSPQSGLRAVGIARLGVFSDSLTQKQAFARALESINANLGTWYFAEHFDNALGTDYHSFYEFSIEDEIDSSDVQISATETVNRWLFVEISLKEPVRVNSDTTTINWKEAVGVSPMLWTNPYLAFEKAKQNALKEIAFNTELRVSGFQWGSGGYSGDLFFIKSKVLLEGLEVVNRQIINGKCFVHIRIPNNGITTF